MINGEIGLMQYFVNYCKDIYCTNGLEILTYNQILDRNLRDDGYQRIVFFKNTGEGFITHCYDHFSKVSFLNPKKAYEMFDVNHINESKENIVKELSRKEVNDLFSKKGKTNQKQEIEVNKKIENYEGFVEILKTNIKNCLEDEKIKTAIIFSADTKKYFSNQVIRQYNSDLDLFFKYLEENKTNGNIIIFTFDNLGEFARFGVECDEIFPIFKKLGADSHGINYIERETDYFKMYQEIFGDSLHLFLTPNIDEIQNLIERFVLMNDFDFNDQEIELIARIIKDEMHKVDNKDRIIEELFINPQSPLLSIQNTLLEKKHQPEKQTQENYHKLQKYIQKYQEKNTIQDVRKMVGIEEFLMHIDKIQKAYQAQKRHTNQKVIQDKDLTRLGSVYQDIEFTTDFKLLLNTLLLGNPGTGKTTVARLYGQILKEMGIIKNGHVVEVSKSTLKGEYVGQSIAKMNKALQDAEGGVLFIDEFYTFNTSSKNSVSDSYDKEIIEVILTAAVNPKIHVVFVGAGYEKQTLDMINKVEGLASRFPSHVHLHDYDAHQMYDIFLQWLNDHQLCMSEDFQKMSFDFLSNWHVDRYSHPSKEWANVRTLENEFLNPLKNHIIDHVLCENTIPQDLKKYYCPKEQFQKEVYHGLDRLIGLQNVKNELQSKIITVKHVSPQLRKKYFQYNYIFAGNPGTGKTEVARQFGKICALYHIVECGRTFEIDIENFMGHANAGEMLLEELTKGLGNVVFIDEAYRLDPVAHSRSDVLELYTTLMKFMEDHKGEIIIILAGYSQEMKRFIEANPGMTSRVTQDNFIKFDDYSTDELIQILELNLHEDHIDYDPAILDGVRLSIEKARKEDPIKFGNARYITRNRIPKYLVNKSKRIDQYMEEHHVSQVPQHINRIIIEDIEAPQGQSISQNNSQTVYAPYVLQENQHAKTILYNEDKQAFYQYYAQPLLLLQVETTSNSKATGTGFIITSSGLALTCAHVVSDAKEITAVLKIKGRIGGEISRHTCQIVKMDTQLDIALLQLEGDHFPIMKLASTSYQIHRGEEFILLGYPMGHMTSADYTAFEGSVASVEQFDQYGDIYFINGEAKHGNSGGCVISKETGEVIGILTGALLGQDKALDSIRYFRPIHYFWEHF